MKKHAIWLTMCLLYLMSISCDLSDSSPKAKTDQSKSSTAALQLILIGGPGAGKGTQAKKIKEKYRIPHISTGQMLRDEVAKGSDLGKEVAEVMQRGALVSDEIILRLVEERLKLPDAKKGFILDGFPRTLAQAKGLEPILQRRGSTVLKVLLLNVSDAEIMKRLLSRGRADDSEETINNRIQKFHSETTDAINYYDNNGVLIRINGEQSIDAVAADIEKVLSGA